MSDTVIAVCSAINMFTVFIIAFYFCIIKHKIDFVMYEIKALQEKLLEKERTSENEENS